MLYPESSANSEEVETIVFEDRKDDKSDINFSLAIRKEDLEIILMEISEYFIYYAERDHRDDTR